MMAVTMIERTVGDGKPYKVPKLHRIVWKTRTWAGSPSYLDENFPEMDAWCEKNCRHPYYHGPAWQHDCFIEFECDQDATMFALRWL